MQTDRKVLNYNNVTKIIAKHKKIGKKIVFASGCFDIMHLGHVIFLQDAKNQGDVLIVGIGSDETVRKLKGAGRPILNEKLRSRMLAALEVVDYVVINKEKLINYNIDHSILISKIKPDIYLVPIADKKLKDKKNLVEKYGGKIKTCRRLPPNHLKGGISSTKILEKIGW